MAPQANQAKEHFDIDDEELEIQTDLEVEVEDDSNEDEQDAEEDQYLEEDDDERYQEEEEEDDQYQEEEDDDEQYQEEEDDEQYQDDQYEAEDDQYQEDDDEEEEKYIDNGYAETKESFAKLNKNNRKKLENEKVILKKCIEQWFECCVRVKRNRVVVQNYLRRWLVCQRWRRTVKRFALNRWRAKMTCDRGLFLVLIARQIQTRRAMLRIAFFAMAASSNGHEYNEELVQVASEHLERISAENYSLKQKADNIFNNARSLAVRVIISRCDPLVRRSHLHTAWSILKGSGLQTPLPAIRLSKNINALVQALTNIETNTIILRDIFTKYARTVPCSSFPMATKSKYTNKIIYLLPLDRLWTFAKDFGIAPSLTTFPALMQIAKDQMIISRTPTLIDTIQQYTAATDSNKNSEMLRFAEFLAVIARVAFDYHAAKRKRATTKQLQQIAAMNNGHTTIHPAHLAHSLLRTLDASGGLAKLGLTSRRFQIVPLSATTPPPKQQLLHASTNFAISSSYATPNNNLSSLPSSTMTWPRGRNGVIPPPSSRSSNSSKNCRR